jgi:large subunit ribosomal protein L35
MAGSQAGVPMPKNKPNKGLVKRVRITASGRVKFGRAFARHRRSHKSGKLLRSYRRSAYAHPADVRRIAGMLHRRLSAGKSRRASDSRSTENTAPVTTAPVETAPVEEAPVETKAKPAAKKTEAKKKTKTKAKTKKKSKAKSTKD